MSSAGVMIHIVFPLRLKHPVHSLAAKAHDSDSTNVLVDLWNAKIAKTMNQDLSQAIATSYRAKGTP